MDDRKHRVALAEKRPQGLVLRVQILLRIAGGNDPRLQNLLHHAGRIGALTRAKTSEAVGDRRQRIADRCMSPTLKACAQAIAETERWRWPLGLRRRDSGRIGALSRTQARDAVGKPLSLIHISEPT